MTARSGPPLKGHRAKAKAAAGPQASAKRRRAKGAPPGTLPSKEELRGFLAEQGRRVGKSEIARAFALGPDHRAGLRDLLRALKADGSAVPVGRRGVVGAAVAARRQSPDPPP